jgi:hypothetical protein
VVDGGDVLELCPKEATRHHGRGIAEVMCRIELERVRTWS